MAQEIAFCFGHVDIEMTLMGKSVDHITGNMET